MVEKVLIIDINKVVSGMESEVLDVMNYILREKYSFEESELVDVLDCREDYPVIDEFSYYNRYEINKILKDMKNKKIQYILGKCEVLLEHTRILDITLDRKAYTFLAYIVKTYSK